MPIIFCSPAAHPATNGYLGQPVTLGTVKTVGRDDIHITPLRTETIETGACSTTPSLNAAHA